MRFIPLTVLQAGKSKSLPLAFCSISGKGLLWHLYMAESIASSDRSSMLAQVCLLIKPLIASWILHPDDSSIPSYFPKAHLKNTINILLWFLSGCSPKVSHAQLDLWEVAGLWGTTVGLVLRVGGSGSLGHNLERFITLSGSALPLSLLPWHHVMSSTHLPRPFYHTFLPWSWITMDEKFETK